MVGGGGVTLRDEVTDVTPPRGYRRNKAAPCVFFVLFFFSPRLGKTLRTRPVCAFHHDPDNLMQDGETAANLQVIKPQWFTVGTAPVCTVEAAAAVWPGSVTMMKLASWAHTHILAMY